jgi:hypothetical protein
VVGLEVQPASVKLDGKYDFTQLLVIAKLASGDVADATRLAAYKTKVSLLDVSKTGQLNPLKNGKTEITVTVAGITTRVPVVITNVRADQKVDFVRDVNPVLSRLGCNAGTCHGAKDGKVGFKLSLRGYDPIYDVRALKDDLAGRRMNFASPDDSLMLLKATAGVPHEGGQRTKVGDKYYQILRAWIADGANLDTASQKVARIEVFPKDPVVQDVGARQQVRIIGTYPDGKTRDVTAEAYVDSGNMDIASAETGGLIKTLRRGEAPILARYEGAYAATTVTVMGDRSGFEWLDQPSYNKIDELVAAKWKRMKILPSGLCTDEEFIRRAHLDLTGLPPSSDDVRKFLADTRESRAKRDELTSQLIGNPDYVDHWANKWADLLQVNRKFLGEEGAKLFRDWIRAEVATNTPYDKFAMKILTATGSNRENPPAAYFKVLRTPAETMENTTHLFLATRFNCNKCHDHPFERWTQDQYYHMAAFFAQVDLKKDPASEAKTIGGTAVEGAKPLYEIAYDKTEGEVKHDRTGKVSAPDFPYPAKFELRQNETSRRQKLAEWMTSPDNRYFAMSYANRIWGYLMGVGIIEPLDDIRAGNPPSNPELLEYLTQQFIESGFNVRELIRLICQSRTYQLSLATQRWNLDDKINYSHAVARRLPAEVLFDAVLKVTGANLNFPGVKAGTRASQLPDSGIDVPSGFLGNLGRPARESACECERSNDIRLGSVMALLSGPTVSSAINDPKNQLAHLTSTIGDDHKLVEEVFMSVLNRAPSDAEVKTTLEEWSTIAPEHRKLTADLEAAEKTWVPIYARKQAEREDAIKLAKSNISARETEIAPKVAEDEKKRADKIEADTQALAEYEAKAPAKQAEWEKGLLADSNRLATAWIPLEIKDAKATGGVVLTKQKDGSLLASGDRNVSDYTITATTHLAGITGVMVEALPDESLPMFGPGRAKDGNFVLNEIDLKWGDKPGKRSQVEAKFVDARADHSQKDFDVKTAIDGKLDGNNGWGISGKPFGEPRYARFSLAKPIGDDKGERGAMLTLTLYQRFKDTFQLGRFRLWLTTSKQPLELGLPAGIAEALKTPADDRDDDDVDALTDYYRGTEPGLLKKQHDLVTSKKPLPIDPKLLELRQVLVKAELPVPIDPKLVQLRQDMQMSTKQVADKRLTGVQDLAWALINNPAFLFNH